MVKIRDLLSEIRSIRSQLRAKMDELCGLLNQAFREVGIDCFAKVSDDGWVVEILGLDTDMDGERLWKYLEPDDLDIISGGSMRISPAQGKNLRKKLYDE